MDLLPISGATLATDPTVLVSVRTIGAQYGVDYLDDDAVTEMFEERRDALREARRGRTVWIGGAALVTGALWPFLAPLILPLGDGTALTYAPAGPLLLLAATALTSVRLRWRRELRHPALNGYRHVLGVARARGLPVAYIPAWLEGRSEYGTGRAAVAVPVYRRGPEEDVPLTSPKEPRTPKAPKTPTGQTPPAPALPEKPTSVTAYEATADDAGWHTETGCLLIALGAAGAGYAWWEGTPIAYGTLLLVPLAITVWRTGTRRTAEREHLREESLTYLTAIADAQSAGAAAPELSPALRKLLDEEEWLNRH